VYFAEEFEEEAPFDFVLLSSTETMEGEDYLLEMKLIGEEIPNELKIESNLGKYNLRQSSKIKFEYKFNNLNEDLEFVCEANGFKSEKFTVSVLKKPIIESIDLSVVYPKHTGRANEKFNNTGDITVPEGSTIEWNIEASNLSALNAVFNDTTISLKNSVSNGYSFRHKFFSSQEYLLTLSSDEIENADSLKYNVGVIKDEYPTITIKEEIDSTNNLKRFVEGTIGDDYGFRSLAAVIKVIGKDTSYSRIKPLSVKGNVTQQLFSYYINLENFDLSPGDRLEYSFVVTDNDELNGFKSTSSSKQIFAVPELDELDNLLSEKDDQIKKEMDEALSDASELKKKIKDIKSNMVNKANLDWKDKQSLENLLNLQKDLTKKIKDLKKEFDKNQTEKDNFLENSEELKEKQEQLEKLLEELLDDEMKELLEELQELMEEMNKDELLEKMEQMEMETENMEEELDRTLELFKNMELDQKLENLQEQLEDLAKQQDELNEQTQDKNSDSEELKKEQEKINEKFEEIKEDIDEIQEKNDDLENPRDMEFDDELEKEVEENLQDAEEKLGDDKKKKSSESQKDASDGMKEMAESASQMQSQMQAQQQAEDMDALRYLLENLVMLSHDQENLMNEYEVTKTSDPYYLELNRKQLDIDRNTEIVNDSLVALSKRVFQLSTFINEELSELEYNLNKSLIYSEERNTGVLKQHQQYTMTGYNDLALMLSEVLNQMQQQAASQQSGGGSCNNPGGQGQGQSKSKGGQMSMQQMKDALKDQIGKMKGGKEPGGEDGQNEQGNKPGGSGGMGSIPGLSPKEVAKMAAQQGQIRESLKKMRQELNKDGSGNGNSLNDLIEDLDQMEEDLLNGKIGNDFVKRQEDILTRLLESEKALRERGYSEERESEEGKNKEEGNLIEFTEYNRKKKAEAEFLRSLPVELRVYYKALVNEYFNSVNE
jgi:hypothetical protein